jgi:hypothetical protein
VLTRQFRYEEPGPDDHPDAVIEHLRELPAVLASMAPADRRLTT